MAGTLRLGVVPAAMPIDGAFWFVNIVLPRDKADKRNFGQAERGSGLRTVH